MRYKNEHRFRQPGLDRDSEHIQHTTVTHLQAYFVPHQYVAPFRYVSYSFLSYNSVTYYTIHISRSDSHTHTYPFLLAIDYGNQAKCTLSLLMPTAFCSLSSPDTSHHGTQSSKSSDVRQQSRLDTLVSGLVFWIHFCSSAAWFDLRFLLQSWPSQSSSAIFF